VVDPVMMVSDLTLLKEKYYGIFSIISVIYRFLANR